MKWKPTKGKMIICETMKYGRAMNFNIVSQCPKMILNKIEKTFNKTYTGLKSFFRDSKSVFLKILAVRAWNLPARQKCQIGPIQAVSAALPSWWIPCP